MRDARDQTMALCAYTIVTFIISTTALSDERVKPSTPASRHLGLRPAGLFRDKAGQEPTPRPNVPWRVLTLHRVSTAGIHILLFDGDKRTVVLRARLYT